MLRFPKIRVVLDIKLDLVLYFKEIMFKNSLTYSYQQDKQKKKKIKEKQEFLRKFNFWRNRYWFFDLGNSKTNNRKYLAFSLCLYYRFFIYDKIISNHLDDFWAIYRHKNFYKCWLKIIILENLIQSSL